MHIILHVPWWSGYVACFFGAIAARKVRDENVGSLAYSPFSPLKQKLYFDGEMGGKYIDRGLGWEARPPKGIAKVIEVSVQPASGSSNHVCSSKS